ncbi:hypothetical protein BHF71_08845 [Vulcanibacillus modesticaldus]|uniref:Putative Flp pilus-assembly TadG-like N-terminal domain-containing protein n=1 Tax=Vulcanibacillus modesticaldus TaxID=337097 RepID=A0A1D2YV48_9BACI|nr:pilus assembly protein TadG-related protein [Vulcanibacillus modesticaldus]OEF99516.1 hypothetical protein BHF71_08845 [Vulcanibacillus modesticaldus]
MNNERGNITLLLLISMTLIISLAAMVVDVGYLMLEQQRLGDALDAAALAGAQELINDQLQAEMIARQYAIENGVSDPQIIIDPVSNTITVNGTKDIPFFFAKAIGFDQTTIQGSSVAGVKPLSSASGIVPLAIEQQSFEYGALYTLKYGAQGSSNGNFGALALGGNGASNYRDNLKYGYQGKLSIGMKVSTEPGNMSGPTESGMRYRIDSGNRVVIVPIVDSLDVNGRAEVTIVGFAAFYLEDVTRSGRDSVIEGRFLKMIFSGEWDNSGQGDFGLYAVKLVH